MLGVPVGLETWVDLAVYHEYAVCSLANPSSHWIEIGKRSDRRRPRSIAVRNRSEIRFRELHNVDRVALTTEVMNFGRIRTVVVEQDAHSKPEPNCGFEVCDRHHEAAITGPENGQLARICQGKTDRRR
jgi:hypothetical protein